MYSITEYFAFPQDIIEWSFGMRSRILTGAASCVTVALEAFAIICTVLFLEKWMEVVAIFFAGLPTTTRSDWTYLVVVGLLAAGCGTVAYRLNHPRR